MMNTFTVTARFPVGEFNAHDGDGEPEWPPSPARLLSALLAAAHSSGQGVRVVESLFALQPPEIFAPPCGMRRVGHRRWVPVNNELKNDASGIIDEDARFAQGAQKAPERGVLVGTGDDDVVHWIFEGGDGVNMDVLRKVAREVSYLGRPTSPVILDIRPGADQPHTGHDHWWPDRTGDVIIRVATPELLRALDAREERRRRSSFTGTHPPLEVRPVARYRSNVPVIGSDTPVGPRLSAVMQNAALYRFPQGASGEATVSASDAMTVVDQLRARDWDLDWILPLFGEAMRSGRGVPVLRGVLLKARPIHSEVMLAVRGGVVRTEPLEPRVLASLPRTVRAATALSKTWTSVVPLDVEPGDVVAQLERVANCLGAELRRVERHAHALAEVGPDAREPGNAYHLTVTLDRAVSGPFVLDDKVWLVPLGATGLAVNAKRRI